MSAFCAASTTVSISSPARPFPGGNSIPPPRTALPSTLRPRFRFRSDPRGRTSEPDRLPLRRFPLLQRRINRRIGTHLVIRLLGPALYREVAGINARYAAFPHHNFSEDIPIHRDRSAEQPVLSFVRGGERGRQLYL